MQHDAKHLPSEPAAQCSFCGKTAEQVAEMIAGPGSVAMCGECVVMSLELISRDALNLRAAYSVSNWSPSFCIRWRG